MGPATMADMANMECNELVDRVTDYLEGALSRDDRVRMNAHLGVCRSCEAHMGEVHVTLRLMSRLPAERLSGTLESNLLATYRKWSAIRS